RRIGHSASMAEIDWRPPERPPASGKGRSWASIGWRIILAVGLPAVALLVAFPLLRVVTTVYNEPTDKAGAFTFSLFLTLLPGLALAVFVRRRWLFAIGVALSAAAAVVVAIQVA